ncbi:MAG: hypothetical protein AB7N76_09960 [Planctomycetota bacterium]
MNDDDDEPARCAYCREPLQPHEWTKKCERCAVEHHQECFEALSGCSDCAAYASGRRQERPARPRPAKPRQAEVPLPDGFRIERSASELVLEVPWRDATTGPLAVGCVVWNAIVLLGVAFAVSVMKSSVLFGVGILLVVLAAGAAGPVLAYLLLGALLNTTTLRADAQTLSLRSGPVPFPGDDIPVEDIAQLYCKASRSHGKRGRTYLTYDLKLIDRQGQKRDLFGGLQSPEQARFLEQELETFLGIVDRPVRGELEG